MPTPALSEAILRQLAWVLADIHRHEPDLPPLAKGNERSVLSEALVHLATPGCGASTWGSRWRKMKTERQDLLPPFMREALGLPDIAATPEAAPQPEPRTLAGDVALQRAQTGEREALAQLKEARARIAELQDQVDFAERLRRSNPRPAEWTLPKATAKGEHIPELLFSDAQIGEVIRASETDGAHGYDVAIFRQRYRLLVATAIDLCLHHAGGMTFPGIIYCRAGDTISGGIHDELAETDELTPIEAVQVAVEEEAAGIALLADAFDRVEVKSVPGNHDRDTHKPRSKRAAGHSYDTLVEAMLRLHFKDDPRVTFQGSESPDVFFPVYGRNYLLTHGDKIGSRGGQGFVGPAATIARGFQKVIMEQALLGRHVERVRCGHFHTPLVLEQGESNGCVPGYSEFAKLNRMRPAPPSQWLMFHHPKWGIVDRKQIFLEERA